MEIAGIKSWLYDEEDYSLSSNELIYRATAKENKTFARFFFLVLECFMPQSVVKQLKNRNAVQK